MVITNVNQVVYRGDGVTTAFPFTFRIIDATDIKLLLIDADGTETDIQSDYFVDTVNNTVHYPGYAPGAEPPEADQPAPVQTGQKLVIYRELPITQEKNLGDKWPFFVIELALDKLTLILQQIYGWWGRTLKFGVGWQIDHPDFDTTIPVEAGKAWRVNDEGTGFVATGDPDEAIVVANNAKDVAAEAKDIAQDAKNVADDAADSATNAANSAANSAKAAADSATAAANSAREQQADWNVTDSTSKAFIKNKPEVYPKATSDAAGNNIQTTYAKKSDLNFIPQSYTNFTDYSKMSIISREANLENVPPSTYANVRAIKECKASGKVDLSSTAHKVIDDVRLWSKDAALYINKESGWSGSNKFNHIYSYDAEYPFTLYCNDVTDTFLTESTFEEFRQGVRTNAPLTIQRCYFGDNTDFEVDSENPDCAILAKSKADIKVDNSTISISCRKGLDSTCLIKFDSTENEPATVYLKDCKLGVYSQNLKDNNGGAIADLSNKNDRLIIDNCTFDVYPKRLHDGHSVMPYMLKPFKTVWSYNPFKSYLIGGKMLDVTSFTPAYQNINSELYPTILETENALKNPFGGNLVKLKGDFYLTYHVPKELVGTVMYAHIYIYDLKGSNPTLSYDMSDGTNIKGWRNEWCKKGERELSKLTPYLNIFSFIPTKEKGKFAFHNTEKDDYMVIAGAALVQEINKNKLCDYEEAYQE